MEFKFLKGKRTVQLQSGKAVNCDLVFWAMGAKVNSKSFKDTLPMNEQGRLDIDEYYQVKGFEGNIWAFGDCAGTQRKMMYFAMEQSKVVASNIKHSLKGKKEIQIL